MQSRICSNDVSWISWANPACLSTLHRRGRGGELAGLTRGRKEVAQVGKEEELDRQGSDTDTSLDSDDNTMVAWEEEEESE